MDTAVLIIDMQNGFCHEQGSLPLAGMGLPNMPAVVGTTAELLAAARSEGVPVVYTRHVFRPDFLDAPARLFDMLPRSPEPLVRGSWDAEVIDELAPTAADTIIDKNRYDAFLYTDLEVVLRGLGVTRLLVTGVVTSVCVESSVRSAEQRDFEVSVAADCTSAPVGAHEPALAAMAAVFATVGGWRELFSTMVGAPAAA